MDKVQWSFVPSAFANSIRTRKMTRKFTRAEIVALQNKKLRRVIRHSFEKVPYYNRLFRASGIMPDDVKTIEDLNKIPISKKSDFIKAGLQNITTSDMDLRKNALVRTSGSSGIYFEFYREKKEMLTNSLRYSLFQLESGAEIRDKQVAIGAWLPQLPFERFGIFPQKKISPFEDTLTQIRRIVDFNPRVLVGNPSSIRVIAKEIANQKISVKIPLIFMGGEIVDAYTRRLAETVFGAEVFETYGMTEVGGIFGECRSHTGFHVWNEQVIVETSCDGEKVSPGEKGCITVTGLNRYSTPFIRYNTEDIGIVSEDECVCGSQLQLMEITEGRRSDVVLLNDGRVIPAHEICVLLSEIQGIRQFQLIQESTNRLTVKVVKEAGFRDTLHNDIITSLRRKIGDVDIDVSMVDDIPRLKSGKLKRFISKIQQSSSNS